ARILRARTIDDFSKELAVRRRDGTAPEDRRLPCAVRCRHSARDPADGAGDRRPQKRLLAPPQSDRRTGSGERKDSPLPLPRLGIRRLRRALARPRRTIVSRIQGAWIVSRKFSARGARGVALRRSLPERREYW